MAMSRLSSKGLLSKMAIFLGVILLLQTLAAGGFISDKWLTKVAHAATQTIESTDLTVTLDDTFPKVVQYQWKANNALLYGQEDALTQVKINGTLYTPTVTFSKTANTATYILNISSINVIITIQIKVIQNTVEFNVTNISDNGSTKVSSFEIPNHNLLSVRSNQTGAAFAGNRMYVSTTGTGDTMLNVTGTPTADSTPQGYMYGFLNTNQLSAGLWTNSVYDSPSGATAKENSRVMKQTVNKTSYYRTGLWSGSWLYRASGSTQTEPLPSAKIAIAADRNGDGTVNWQDGAIAFRSIMNNPLGADRIPQLVVQRIPMNFASQTTQPFLKTLDETKKVYLATDGLGQNVLLKGYASEGHDSGHPDYGGNIGVRQGGAADMNTLVNAGAVYNADFGVHVNATESYPEAKAFSETLVNKTSPGWDWLDASYYIRTRDDATSGNRLSRFQQLKNDVPGLKFVYLDVWYGDGWESRQVAREINQQGFRLETEFPDTLEYDSTWTHWAVDYAYGGTTNNKGFNSQIARFIRNHQKDAWIARDPLLGSAEMADYEGWQGRVNFNSMIEMTFNTDLPAKYLQNFPITRWTSNTVDFENNVSATNASGTRIITKNGVKVLDGTKYLLPWEPINETKLYHWNLSGGSSTWTLPASWSGLSTVKLYKLTDQGKQLVGDLPVTSNQITINATAKTPYVIYKSTAPTNTISNWGEGTRVNDPSFESGGLSNWTVTGTGAAVQRNTNGQYELKISSGGATVGQQISGLSPGTYSASVSVQVDGTRRASIGVKNYGGVEVTNYTDSSIATNYIQADSKKGTKMQKMRVLFDVPAGQSTADLYLKADNGSAVVTFDEVRVVPTVRAANPTGAYLAEDFEHVDQGLFPFVKGAAGGVNDPRTHLAELHAPFTQKGWNGNAIDDVISGNWSLKAHKEATGLLLQTIPQTLRLVAGNTYKVSFKYESAVNNSYAFIVGDGTTEVSSTNIGLATTPTVFSKTFTAAASGNGWVGLKNVNGSNSDFVLDDLLVEDLSGPVQIPDVPSSLSAAAPSSSQINVTWTGSTGATSYDIEVDGTIATGVSSPYSHVGLTAGSTHMYKVRAVNAAGISAWSTAVVGTTMTVDMQEIPRTQMTATATSQETVNEDASASKAIDGNSETFWHTKWDLSNPLPQSITLNLGGNYPVKQIKYLPRQDGGQNGNITSYKLYTSTDGVNFTQASTGTWVNDTTEKTADLPSPVNTGYVKLEATAGTGGWASAAEISVFQLPGTNPPASYTQDFSNGIGGWNVVSGSGSASLQSGALRVTANNSSTIVVDSSSPSKADGTYEVKVTPQNTANRAGVVFRYNSPTDWAGIVYDTGTNWFWVNGAGGYGSITSTGPALTNGITATIKVQYAGSNITVWVDDTQIYQGAISQLPTGAGKIGVRSWNAAITNYDDVVYSD
ncbi:endo-alpha-N-acetylgalactosaminidase family protein [Paenibacillus sp. N1-5-1-14]|uniref:endo-alpha-N-acetylgalactosaminidase family protein n=1 Tax=Paenibacillus radicibacter TaxID=2972488 RepID=UPI0021596B46|nr:endo-alpha-N-acetylgalactosaminidase family protein [Paenibacillus radicibacter]MCR8644547.1 endo-alpha-N-acetylgalactosaminidase family protein [Paenibacillus radicibacter]